MPTNKKTVLIIDDSSVNNLLLENILLDEGYEVIVSFNGSDALDIVAKQIPDLILLDIMMPGLNGFTVLKNLRANDATKKVPVIMVSAKSDSVDVQKSMELGATDYIIKPINIQSIVDKIKNTLKEK